MPPSRRSPRIIAGEAGGRRLAVPPGEGVRPTSDRVKESVFSALGPGRLVGARVLDLYAGSGALGLEALSRGAAGAVLVERDAAAARAIRANIETLGFGDRAAENGGHGGDPEGRPLLEPQADDVGPDGPGGGRVPLHQQGRRRPSGQRLEP